jgi:TorA maturation chaperone TorD
MNTMMENLTVKEKAARATGRSSIYGFLATIFREEITMNQLHHLKTQPFIKALFEPESRFYDALLNKPEEQLIEDLAVEYARLFLGPDKHISPHESVHHERDGGDWGSLWGKSTVEVKKFIESAGLEYITEYSGLPDHISVELEFMQQAASREAQAWELNDSEGALYCLKMEKKFLDDHILKWIPLFCDKIIADTKLSFYREIAELTKNFIELEIEEIDGCIPKTPDKV